MYKEVKLANKALNIEFFKTVLENIVSYEEYYILGDGKMFVTIWLKNLLITEDKKFIVRWEEVKKFLLRLEDKDPNLNFKSKTFKIWKKMTNYKEQYLGSIKIM